MIYRHKIRTISGKALKSILLFDQPESSDLFIIHASPMGIEERYSCLMLKRAYNSLIRAVEHEKNIIERSFNDNNMHTCFFDKYG